MKAFRLVLLVLLAVLLPLRGVAVAAMLCPEAATQTTVAFAEQPSPEQLIEKHLTGAHTDPLDSIGQVENGLEHAPEHSLADDLSGHDAGSCVVTPLAIAPPGLPLVPAVAEAFLPQPPLAAVFLTDGPQRPPRSI